jgi:hypothetical protein
VLLCINIFLWSRLTLCSRRRIRCQLLLQLSPSAAASSSRCGCDFRAMRGQQFSHPATHLLLGARKYPDARAIWHVLSPSLSSFPRIDDKLTFAWASSWGRSKKPIMHSPLLHLTFLGSLTFSIFKKYCHVCLIYFLKIIIHFIMIHLSLKKIKS